MLSELPEVISNIAVVDMTKLASDIDIDAAPDEAGESRDENAASIGGPISGLLHSISQVLATLLGMAHTRLELFTAELQEEVQRAAMLLLWALAALFALGIGCFLAALSLIFAFWDTHRILVAVCVTAAFFAIALLAVLVVVKKLRKHPRMLQGTLSELKRDHDSLRARR